MVVFNNIGTFSYKFGGNGTNNGEFLSPISIKYSLERNEVFVLDNGKCNLQFFNVSGFFVGSFGSKGSQNGMFLFPSSFSFGDNGVIFVSDLKKNNVQIFSNDFSFLNSFGISFPFFVSSVVKENSCSLFVLSENLVTQYSSVHIKLIQFSKITSFFFSIRVFT